MNLVIDECVEMAPGGQQNNIGMVVSVAAAATSGGVTGPTPARSRSWHVCKTSSVLRGGRVCLPQ